MRIMTVLTTIKFAILTLILCVGLLAAVGVLPRDPQAGMNLSFTGTTTDIGPYASALYYVRLYKRMLSIKTNSPCNRSCLAGYEQL